MNVRQDLAQPPPGATRSSCIGGSRRRGHHQGRHSALPVGHHGHQRVRAQGHGSDADRGPEQEGRVARQETRAGHRRPGVGLGRLYGQGIRTARKGKGRGRIRVLDLQLPKGRYSCLRAIQRSAFLSRSIRRRGKLAQCLLHRRCAKPAGHSGRSLSDEQGRWREFAAGFCLEPIMSIRGPPTGS